MEYDQLQRSKLLWLSALYQFLASGHSVHYHADIGLFTLHSTNHWMQPLKDLPSFSELTPLDSFPIEVQLYLVETANTLYLQNAFFLKNGEK
jgi:hypothetical protein